jgi:phenylalanyl-tRNA synthetase beta chain
MQFSESWLRSLVNPPLSTQDLAHVLTMAGLEVEDVAAVSPPFDRVVVGRVMSSEKHPDADRLKVLTVDVGQEAPLSIVCGAPNVTVGMKAPCALVGAKLPGSDTGKPLEIKQAKVRGVVSFGMMCSAKELGLAEETSGLMELPSDAPVGQSLRTYLDLDDHIISLKLTPNRSDCLSLHGIAREVSALTGFPVRSIAGAPLMQDSNDRWEIRVDEPRACPRYAGCTVRGVHATLPTPSWMVQRLERCGLRSINALVDVTNYVMLELGQPLHAFDVDKLTGGIEVRFARAGESLQLLNQQNVTLEGDTLVIADGKGPVALAGIMGGMQTAVDDATTSIFLESAFFSPTVIAGKSRRLGLSSDSSFRFERGVDFAGTRQALERATQLIIEICGGTAGMTCEVIGELPARHPIKLRSPRVKAVLGVALEPDAIAKTLSVLGMQYERQDDIFQVTPPTYRFDLAIEEDMIEEVARIYGYDRIVPLYPQVPMRMLPQPEARLPLIRLRHSLVCRDYYETINYAFVEPGWEHDLCENLNPVVLRNPIASHMSVMRSSLLPGLLNSMRTNVARKQSRVRLFEVGGCFGTAEGGYAQYERLAGVAYGSAFPEQWGGEGRNVDFYDVKGDLESLFHPHRLMYEAAGHPASHPGRSAQILLNGCKIGWIGELHPKWQQVYGFAHPLIWFEVELEALGSGAVPKAGEVSCFPSVRRDLAVLVDDEITVQALLQAMLAERVPYVRDVALFDVYRGIGVEKGKKSLAFRVLLQDTQKTLVDNEIDQSIARLLAVLQKQGARLRV